MPMKKKKKAKNKRRISKRAATKRTKKSAIDRHKSRPTKTAKKKQSRVTQTKKTSLRTSPARRSNPLRPVAEESDSRRAGTRVASDRQSDFEGLSRAEQADSESVDELVEEGNVFEAGAVAGVEAADDEDTKEVRTHEFPEDDVPEEYLDKD
jgi:hypothetical protein